MNLTYRHVLASALALSSAAASAQSAGPMKPDEVVVTATRTPQPLSDYAGSVTRIAPDYISLVGSTHHSESINAAPGALIQRNNGQESLTAVRSPVLSGPGSCGVFLFLEDSVPIRPVGFCNVNELFEVNTEQAQAIEVLRGPAGALYGSSAMHGAINVIPAAPGDLPRFSTALEAGPDDYYRAKFGLSRSGAGGDFGINGVVTDDGGWRDSSGVREQKLNVSYGRETDSGRFALRLAATNLNQETASYIEGENAYRDEDIVKSNDNPEAYRDAYAVRLTGLYETTLTDSWDLQVRPYVRSSRMNFLQHFLIGQPTEENGQDSIGVLTAFNYSNARGLDVIAGIDLERAEGFLKETQDGPATGAAPAALAIRPAGKHYDYETTSTVAALYGHAEQSLGEGWLLTAGLRAERVEYDYDNLMIAGNTTDSGVPCPTAAGCLYSRPADRTDTFDYVTPRFGLTYELSDSHSLYVTGARGYRAPDTSELYRLQRQQNVAQLDTERLSNMEFGVRALLDNLRYSVALYAMEKDNVIFRDANAFNVSDGRTKHRGVEYEIAWRALEDLTLSAAGTYAKHTYDFNAIEGSEVITAGRIVDTAPRHVHSAQIEWRFLENARAQLEWQSMGSYFVDASNAHSYGGHDLLHLRTSWNVTPQWQVIARLNNVTDEKYADRADFAFGNYRYFPGRERTLFVEVSYRVKQ
jgi:iron complex outermembrane receptor protein